MWDWIYSSFTSWQREQTKKLYGTAMAVMQVWVKLQPKHRAINGWGMELECVWNVMAHAQKQDLVFRRNGRVHLNRRGRQFSRLLTGEVCTSAVVMLGTLSSLKRCEGDWLPTPFASFPFTSPPVRHRVPSPFNWTLQTYIFIILALYGYE